MDKMNCDIIRDLIPSYVDDICSAATRHLVEDHIAGCSECKMAVTLCRDHALSGEKLDLQGLDGLKKIKQKLKLHELARFCTLLLVIPLGIWIFFMHSNYPSKIIQLTLFVLCLIMNFIAGIAHQGKNPPKKTQYLLGAASLAVDAAVSLVLFWLPLRMLEDESLFFFQMEVHRAGSIVAGFISVFFFLQLIFYLWHFRCAVRQDISCNWLMCLTLTGMFLLLRYHSMLYAMTDADSYMATLVAEISFVACIGLLGLLGCLASFLITRYLRKLTE